MISFDQAVATLKHDGASRPLETERVSLQDAMGRWVSADIRSTEPLPSFTNSAMDGFALQSALTQTATPEKPARFAIAGLVAAGRVPPTHAKHTALEIMTGAPMPESADAVVKIEDVRVIEEHGARLLEVMRPLKPNENVRRKGSDVSPGDVLVAARTCLAPQHVMTLASFGISEVQVARRLSVAVIATGSELVPASTKSLQPPEIRNSSGAYLTAALKQWGATVHELGIVKDDPVQLQARYEQALELGVDLVISTGAVSVGKFDFVLPVLEKMGATVLFHRVAIRPGKPVCFARFPPNENQTAFLGAPGNPISTFVAVRFFLMTWWRARLGLADEQRFTSSLSEPARKPDGLTCFFRATVADGGKCLKLESNQGSHVVGTLAQVNAWAVLPESQTQLEADAAVQWVPLRQPADWS